MTKLDAALAMAGKGYAIFPLVPNGKTPAIKNWQNEATTHPDTIRQWWLKHPDANIGHPTVNEVVIDIDPRHGGKATFAALTLSEDFPRTSIVQTQSGGNHVYYALPPHTTVKGGTSKLGSGVDIKSWGGYVVAPGSTIDGKPYEWLNDRPIAPAPRWLIERCNVHKPRTDAAGERLVEEDDTAVELAQQWLDKHAPDATLGEIDDTAFKVAARLYDFGVSAPTATQMLAEWSELHAFPPMELDRIKTVAASAGRNRDNAIGVRHPDASGFEPVEIAEVGIPTTTQHDKPSKFQSVPAATLAGQALTITGQPLVRGVLDRNTTAVIYGPSGSGKTFATLDVCYHIQAGQEWCGKPVHRGGVLYLAAEGGPGINKRLRALELKYAPLDPTRFHVLPTRVDLLRGNDAKEIYAEIIRLETLHKHKIEVLVVDTLSRVMPGGDENGPQDMTRVIATLDSIREAAKTTALMVHHTGKDATKGLRGHSSLIGAVDTEIKIENRLFLVKKQRDMEGDWGMRFKLDKVRIGVNADGEDVKSCTIAFDAATNTDFAVGLTPRAAKTLEIIKAELDRLGDAAPKTFGWEFVAKAKNVSDSDVKHGLTRTTQINHLSELVTNSLLEKVQENQYVLTVT